MLVHIKIKGLRENCRVEDVAAEVARSYGMAGDTFVTQLTSAIANPEGAKALLENVDPDEADFNLAVLEEAGLVCYTVPASVTPAATPAPAEEKQTPAPVVAEINTANSPADEDAFSLDFDGEIGFAKDNAQTGDEETASAEPTAAAEPAIEKFETDALELISMEDDSDDEDNESESISEEPYDIQEPASDTFALTEDSNTGFEELETILPVDEFEAPVSDEVLETVSATPSPAVVTTAQPEAESEPTAAATEQNIEEVATAAPAKSSTHSTDKTASETNPIQNKKQKKKPAIKSGKAPDKKLLIAAGMAAVLAGGGFFGLQLLNSGSFGTSDSTVASTTYIPKKKVTKPQTSETSSTETSENSAADSALVAELQTILEQQLSKDSNDNLKKAFRNVYSLNDEFLRSTSIRKIFASAELSPMRDELLTALAQDPPLVKADDQRLFDNQLLTLLLENRKDREALEFTKSIKQLFPRGEAAAQIARALASEQPQAPVFIAAMEQLKAMSEEQLQPHERAQLYNSLAATSLLQGDKETAEKLLDKAYAQTALALNIEHRVEALGIIAEDRLYFGDEEMAGRIYDTMLNLANGMSKYNPAKPLSYRYIALSYARSSQFTEARKAASEVSDTALRNKTVLELVEIAAEKGSFAMERELKAEIPATDVLSSL